MRQIGARPKDRVAALEETVAAVRALLAGETVTVHGRHVHLDDVRLAHAPADAAADPDRHDRSARRWPPPGGRPTGSCCPRAACPAAVRWARGEAGGADDRRLRLAEPRRRPLGRRRGAPPGGSQGWHGDGPVPEAAEQAGSSTDESAADLEDDRLRALAVAGDARDCARAIAELWGAGADSVVLVPRHEDRADQVARFAAEVRPLL